MVETKTNRKLKKKFRITKRIRGGAPKPDPAIINKLKQKLLDKQTAERDKQMAERSLIIEQMNAVPAQPGWFWWLPKMSAKNKLAIEAEDEERKQLIAAELKAIEKEKESKAAEEKAAFEKAARKKDKKSRQKETLTAKSKLEEEKRAELEEEKGVKEEEKKARLEEEKGSKGKGSKSDEEKNTEVQVKVGADKTVEVVLPPPPKKQKPKRTINIQNISIFNEARLEELKSLHITSEDLTTNETTTVTPYSNLKEHLEYPMRNVFYEPNAPNKIVKYENEVLDPANSVVRSILRKMFVVYGAIATQLYTKNSPYQLVMKGTRALYLNKEALDKPLITSDIDVSIIKRSDYVEDSETSYEVRKKLAEYISSLIVTICDGPGFEIDAAIPIHNTDIVKITYRNPVSGERIGLSDIGITQEDMIDKSPNPAADIDSYIRMSILIKGIYVTFLYPTIDTMRLEKELNREYYKNKIDEFTGSKSKDNKRTEYKRKLNNMTKGLNKIKLALGEDVDEKTEVKQIVERAIQDRETRLGDAEKVKSGKLTREELQELINSKRKK